MKQRTVLAFSVLTLGLASIPLLGADAPSAAAKPTGETPVQIIDRFVEHMQAAEGVKAAARKVIAEQWQKRRDAEDAEAFLAEALAVLSGDFKDGLAAYESGDYATAAAAMAGLAKSGDPYLSANAAVFEARALVEAERLDAAQKRLTKLLENETSLRRHTLHAADARFLIAYCAKHNLQYDAAVEALESFVRDYPQAPERLRAAARQMLQELKLRKPDGLGDVADLMAYAGRRLGHHVADDSVTDKQARAVALLDALIKECEDKECKGGQCKSCKGKGCKKCGGSGKASGNNIPSSPARESTLPGGKARIGELRRTVARPGEEWGKMPEAERERVLQAIQKHFPTRYRELVEQYYKQLAKQQ